MCGLVSENCVGVGSSSMDSDDDYLYDATDSGNESPEGGDEDHVRTFFLSKGHQELLQLPYVGGTVKTCVSKLERWLDTVMP